MLLERLRPSRVVARGRRFLSDERTIVEDVLLPGRAEGAGVVTLSDGVCQLVATIVVEGGRIVRVVVGLSHSQVRREARVSGASGMAAVGVRRQGRLRGRALGRRVIRKGVSQRCSRAEVSCVVGISVGRGKAFYIAWLLAEVVLAHPVSVLLLRSGHCLFLVVPCVGFLSELRADLGSRGAIRRRELILAMGCALNRRNQPPRS